mmetsp:Transcript_257/g.493  ORF Transcript_257/g.493 Transcript_257/m.493 type:complete len:958 (+) Transcript_257:222-3095(+)
MRRRPFEITIFLFALLVVFKNVLSSAAPPKNFKVVEDDRVATLSWDGGIFQRTFIGGYYVSWGPVSNMSDTTTTVVEYPIAQLQPLENGVPYRAVVVAVDYYGQTSNPSNTIYFTGDSTRVDRLRREMTGFFEDYNKPEGPIDELTWNTAWYSQNDHTRSGVFINNQYHLHNMLAAKIDPSNPDDAYTRVSFCYMRPRATMYFGANETRTIVFDIDGHSRTNWWMLDVLDAAHPLDVVQHQDVRNIRQSAPNFHVRFQSSFDEVLINYFGKNFVQKEVCKITNFRYLKQIGLAPNVRIPWKIRISRTRAEVFVQDINVCAADIYLPFDRAILLWGSLSYRSEAARNMERWISHWDNFGFDGPKSLVETHNYRIGFGIGSEVFPTVPLSRRQTAAGPVLYGVSARVNIPDSIEHAIAARVHFCIEAARPPRGQYSRLYWWTPYDKLTVGGIDYSWNDYYSASVPFAARYYYSSWSDARPLSMVIRVPPESISTGINNLVFTFGREGVVITNIHIEVDFSTAPCAPTPPPYTQPDFKGVFRPSLDNQQLSTGLYFAFWNRKADVWNAANGPTDHPNYNQKYNSPLRTRYKVSGVGVLTIKASGEAAAEACGKYPTLKNLTMEIDQQVYWSAVTNSILTPPSGIWEVTIDTTKLANGVHEIFIYGYSVNGIRTLTDQKDSHPFGKEGYWPLLIDVRNNISGHLRMAMNASQSRPSVMDVHNDVGHSRALKEDMSQPIIAELVEAPMTNARKSPTHSRKPSTKLVATKRLQSPTSKRKPVATPKKPIPTRKRTRQPSPLKHNTLKPSRRQPSLLKKRSVTPPRKWTATHKPFATSRTHSPKLTKRMVTRRKPTYAKKTRGVTSTSTITVHALDDSQLVMDCSQFDPDFRIVNIIGATYGSLEGQCFAPPVSVKWRIADRVVGYGIANVKVSACELGLPDPCPGLLKTLRVVASCGAVVWPL